MKSIVVVSIIWSILAVVVSSSTSNDNDKEVSTRARISDSDSRIIFEEDRHDDDAHHVDSVWYPLSRNENLRVTRSLSPLESLELGIGGQHDDMFGNLFNMRPGRYPSFVQPSMAPHRFIEHMLRHIQEQEERMREEMEKMPADSETTEEIVPGPRGMKLLKKCKTTRRGSGSTIWMERVCKLVPYDASQHSEDSQKEPQLEQKDQQQEQQQQQEHEHENEHEQQQEHEQEQRNQSVPSQENSGQGGSQNGSGGNDELKRKNTDDTKDTIEVPTSA